MAAISSTDVFEAPEATLTESTPDVKTSIWSIKGRLGVLKYMSCSIILTIAIVGIMMAIAAASGISMSGGDPTQAQFSPMLAALAVVTMLPLMWIGCAMFIRRLHDLNLSGWFMLVGIIPVIGALFSLFVICAPGMKEGNKFGQPAKTAAWEKVLGCIGLVFFIVLMVASIVSIVAPSLLGM